MRTFATCPQDRLSSKAEFKPARAGWLGPMLKRCWHAYWDWRARQATVLILRALDNRTLHDIGISASEIESCVYGQRCDRRRGYDKSWRA